MTERGLGSLHMGAEGDAGWERQVQKAGPEAQPQISTQRNQEAEFREQPGNSIQARPVAVARTQV